MILDIWTEKRDDEVKYKNVASVRVAGQEGLDRF